MDTVYSVEISPLFKLPTEDVLYKSVFANDSSKTEIYGFVEEFVGNSGVFVMNISDPTVQYWTLEITN